MMGGSPLARRHCGRTAVRTMLLFDLFVTQAMVDTLERVGTAQAASVALKLSFTRTMEHALRSGKARAIGVSNFTIARTPPLRASNLGSRLAPVAVRLLQMRLRHPPERCDLRLRRQTDPGDVDDAGW